MADHKSPIKWGSAMEVAQEIEETLKEDCLRIQIAGSLRRRRPEVNDIEILLVPRRAVLPDPEDMFPDPSDMAKRKIESLIASGELERRLKINGTPTFGERTKLLVHTRSGIPVDIFACTQESWVNCLFSRTGGKTTNITIASGAKRRGLAWKAFETGFMKQDGTMIEVKSEEGQSDCPISRRTSGIRNN